MDRNELYHLYASYALKHSGIVYDEKNFFQLDSRLENLKKAKGFVSDQQLVDLFQKPMAPEDHALIVDLATNNETFFFRDIKVFHALEKNIFPKLKQEIEKGLKIWSLACSSGQEACSVLITLDKYLQGQQANVKIDASDISSRILKKAQSGTYTQLEVQRGLPIQDLVKYFTPNGEEHWKFREELHRKILFRKFNMLEDTFPQTKYHIVFCRNVLIYQSIEKRKEIVRKIYQSLLPGGFLILGNSENLMTISSEFASETFDGCVVYSKPKAEIKEVAS